MNDEIIQKKILIVEDELIIAENIKVMLNSLGYLVPNIIVSGEEAVDKVGKTNPDLVLMDIKLKGKIDGIETAKQIRADCDIPIIFLTAFSDEATLQKAKITKPFGYIIKPFNKRELQANIEMAFYRHKIERQLRSYVEKQTVLLKEVNHRVRNNLTAVFSILHKEEERAIKNGFTSIKPIILNIERRIKGLLSVHNLLSEKCWGHLNISNLIRKVAKASLEGLENYNYIALEVEKTNIEIDNDKAQHLTMIINELVTNSSKYAINDTGQVSIIINIKMVDNRIIIKYFDNGPGYPKKMIDKDFSDTGVGFNLINGIVKKSLQGNICLSNNNGAIAEIMFKN